MHEGHDPALVVGITIGTGQPICRPAESLHVEVPGRLAPSTTTGYGCLLFSVGLTHPLGHLLVVVSGIVVA